MKEYRGLIFNKKITKNIYFIPNKKKISSNLVNKFLINKFMILVLTILIVSIVDKAVLEEVLIKCQQVKIDKAFCKEQKTVFFKKTIKN